MKFDKVIIEHSLIDQKKVDNILNQVSYNKILEVDSIDQFFGRFKKPYLQKNESLNLYLGEKRGQLVKEAPEAYGADAEKHFYFIHAYNCIYECEYCYLQGYFHNPDIVLFLNHEDIQNEIVNTIGKYENKKVWFHAGEFSDSLALSHISKECEMYWNVFSQHPEALLELRTKSVNLRELLKHPPLPNIITTFSLSSEKATKTYEHKTPSLMQRLKAIQKLQLKGYPVALHLDPIVYSENLWQEYNQLLLHIQEYVDIEKINYVSLGVVRFTKDVYNQVQKNYPQSHLLSQEFAKSFDNKVRYNRPTRMWILKKIESFCLEAGFSKKQLYLCME